MTSRSPKPRLEADPSAEDHEPRRSGEPEPALERRDTSNQRAREASTSVDPGDPVGWLWWRLSGARPSLDRAQVRILAACLLALSALAFSALAEVRPWLIYNAVPSAPLGFYRVLTPAPVEVGDLVLVPVPEAFRGLVEARRYLPPGVPLIKRVVARGGDHVCRFGFAFLIDGVLRAEARERDRFGRPLPLWHGCRELEPGEVFAMMLDRPNSFDSRYFGPINADSIIGKLRPVWTFEHEPRASAATDGLKRSENRSRPS